MAPLWFAPTILALEGGTHEWGRIALFIVAVTIGMGVAEFAGSYSDRDEDRLYGPTNPLVSGELSAGTARKALIVQNIVAGALGFALLLVTLNYSLIIAMIVGWFICLSYSLPPFRFKETVAAPFFHALGVALLPVFAWLIVEPSFTARNGFIIAFATFLFLSSFGFGITIKFRKTLLAFGSGLIRVGRGGSLYDLSTIGFKLKVKTATALEATTTLGAFTLVPIFWHLGIFDMALSVALLALPLPLSVLAIAMRIKDPVKNGETSVWLLGLAWVFVILSLLAVALAGAVHWGYAVLSCALFLLVFSLLVRIVHPWGCKAPSGRKIATDEALAFSVSAGRSISHK